MDWIQEIGRSEPERLDAPTRIERYIMVVHPFWETVKADIVATARAFRTRRRINIEDADHRILLRGDCYGVDLTLRIERETIEVRYWHLPSRPPIRPPFINLKLDMQADHLLLLDGRGCCIDDPARFILERFFEALLKPYRKPASRSGSPAPFCSIRVASNHHPAWIGAWANLLHLRRRG